MMLLQLVLDADADVPPGEKEDMELLERALEKALRIRSGSESSRKDSSGKNLAGTHKKTDACMDVLHSSTTSKESQRAMRLTSKSASHDRKTLNPRPSASFKPGKSKTTNNRKIIQSHPPSLAQAVHQTSRKLQQAVLASASPDEITTSLTKNKTVRSNMPSDKAAPVSGPSSSNKLSILDADWSGASILLQKNGLPSEQTTKWKSLRSKQNRLWEKVIALQRKPVPGRSHFMERMRAMFPRDWPCGSPDQTRTLLHRRIHQGLDLAQRFQAEELLAKQASEMATDLGAEQSKYDSCLTLERLQLMVAELQIFAHQVKKEWKAWDRWRPDGGCLCPTGANIVWGDGITSPLPPTITYRAEAELQELERLRMRVALLQQENYLEQVLLDSLSPQFSSLVPGPGRPNPSVLRDIYSLLGEGGKRFPAIILDSEPE
ncbi:uncharacterized protein LOC121628581 isoform X2 [Melanotaenia boesemani]|uniref:uncharacterized protein LOC121628581 isoform X2 n=1 Tax=Melanotaenia boesemani TaxID=1250792 RepID=UPI001C053E8B|nr:uncharacterized protein LOC121628581 isoform X2 [Melanotaenia boesemani]